MIGPPRALRRLQLFDNRRVAGARYWGRGQQLPLELLAQGNEPPAQSRKQDGGGDGAGRQDRCRYQSGGCAPLDLLKKKLHDSILRRRPCYGYREYP
ncbi:MAG: hypothetical protein QNJ77_02130 [Acidimicrobiia bacterium]|nr:hypothetical protein [Acidimicrobiia bacterium]